MAETITITLLITPFLIYYALKAQREAKHQREIEAEQKVDEQRLKELMDKHKELAPEEIVYLADVDGKEKIAMLERIHNYNYWEAGHLVIKAQSTIEELEEKKRRSDDNLMNRKLMQKAEELYGKLPKKERRESIPEEVKMLVWRRDGGKCVKCDSNEKLEFDHIIPFSKGGSNTERNLQLLCEKCNREKSAKI